jgi:hypothetical protein
VAALPPLLIGIHTSSEIHAVLILLFTKWSSSGAWVKTIRDMLTAGLIRWGFTQQSTCVIRPLPGSVKLNDPGMINGSAWVPSASFDKFAEKMF